MCARSRQSCPTLQPLWTITYQAPLSMGFFRHEYWSGLPCPPTRDLPDPGIKPMSLTSPALAGGIFTTSATWETHQMQTTGHPWLHGFCRLLLPQVVGALAPSTPPRPLYQGQPIPVNTLLPFQAASMIGRNN